MLNALILFVNCALLSIAILYFAIKLANAYRIADHPGEHKQHLASTPFVGGVGIIVVLCMAIVIIVNSFSEDLQKWLVLGICSIIIFMVGFVDDFLRLSYRVRLVIQFVLALIAVLGGGILIDNLGELFFGLPLQLEPFAIPFTIFAIIGGFNIINMIDGVDGLSGSLSLVSLLLLAIVATIAGDMANLLLIAALAGGVVGFLKYNLRTSKKSARVFLGDNGSMLLGLVFAWLLIDLSQGHSPAMNPVTAIWILAIPLMDAVSVMYRRLRAGKSPFKPDRNHLHHLLLKAGYRTEEVVYVIVSLHLLLGLIGLVGLYLNVPDFAMLLGFLLIYMGYFYLTLRPWYYIPTLCFLHTRLHLTPNASRGTFFGNYTSTTAENLALKISKEIRSGDEFWIQIYRQSEGDDSGKLCALALYLRLPKSKNAVDAKLNQFVPTLKQRLENKYNIQMRQLVARKEDKDLITSEDENFNKSDLPDRRSSYRRTLGDKVLVFEVTQD